MNSTSSDTKRGTASPVRIDLLGTAFTIQTDESPDYIQELVSELRVRMSRLSDATKVADPLKLSILAGIVLLDEARHARSTAKREGNSADDGDTVASSLLASLDKRLHEAGL